MAQQTLPVLENALQKTHELFGEIANKLALDNKHDAYDLLRGVLHALRDRIPPESVAKFGAQLNLVVRGIYYDEWHFPNSPLKIRHLDDYMELVNQYINNPKLTPLATDKVAKFFEVLSNYMTTEEIAKVAKVFPEEVRKAIFPAQIFRLPVEM